MSPNQQPAVVPDEFTSNGARLVSTDGRVLPLQRVAIRAEARAGLARVTIEQTFRNPHPDPLRVTYQMPLPAEGAVSGYAFRIGERRVVGEVDRLQAARERFEEALVEGRTAGLLEQERSSLFSQEIGNIPPGAEVVAELTVDQRLRWLEEGAWEWRFPTVVAPRYLGGPGAVADAPKVTVDVADAALPVTASLALTIHDPLGGAHEVHSPSHGLTIAAAAAGFEIGFAAAVALDRDVVVRWQNAGSHVITALDTGRPAEGRAHGDAAYGLLTLTPPRPAERSATLPRDLIVLLDTSGSMHGEPLDQARRVVTRLIDTLGDADRLEMIAFASKATVWRGRPQVATAAAKQQAVRWLAALQADGGTEMREGIAAALRPLRPEAQRQVVLVTDGAIGFESEIVGMIVRDLPPTCRLHTIGVGPAVNRTLTGGAARAGRGAEIVIGLGENPVPVVERLGARLAAPLLTELALSGPAMLEHSPARLPDVHAGAPALIGLKLRPEGGELRIVGRLGGQPWEETVRVPAVAAGAGSPAVVACYGREAVEDLEMRVAAGEVNLDRRIERLGLDFQIATRLTSWIATTEDPTVDPGQPTRRERIPQALPAGLSAAGFGLGRGRPVVARMMASLDASLYFAQPAIPVRQRLREILVGSPRRPRRRAELRGRIVLRRDRELVVELTIEDTLRWDPSDVRAVWPDGTGCDAEIDPTRSTRPGAMKAGQTIRLVLRLDDTAPAGAPTRIELVSAARSIEVALAP